MYGSNVFRMIVPPGSTHSFRISVVWCDIVVVGELFVADRAYPALLQDLAVEQLPHLGRGSQFSISPRMVWIIDSLNSQSHHLWFRKKFSTTARTRSVDGTQFVISEFHSIPLELRDRKSGVNSAWKVDCWFGLLRFLRWGN